MNKFSKVLVILLFPLVLLLGLFFFPINSEKTYEEPQLTREEWQDIQKFISHIQELWSQPDRLKYIDWENSECSSWDFKKYHSQVDLRQNFLVFSCSLNGNIKKTSLKDSTFTQFKTSISQLYLKKIDPVYTYFKHIKKASISKNDYLPFEGITISIGKTDDDDFQLDFTLSYDQRLKYLPQTNYYYGQDVNQLPYQFKAQSTKNVQNFATVRSWDNIGRFIFVEKMPIRNFDLHLWNRRQEKQNQISSDVLAPELVVKYLSLDDQISYCQSRGMKLLDAATFDAATYYRDIRNFKQDVSRSLFYFGDRWPKVHKCQLQKTKDCKEQGSFHQAMELQISWMGLMLFTNDFESLLNDFDPMYNLHPGSQYFLEKSAWQFLGNRMIWSGTGFTQDDFKWTSSILGSDLERVKFETNLPIQFRCMKEWVTYP